MTSETACDGDGKGEKRHKLVVGRLRLLTHSRRDAAIHLGFL